MDSVRLRNWAKVRPLRNLLGISIDWLCMIFVQATGIFILTHLDDWGLTGRERVLWSIPIGAPFVILTGCLMHRIGLMGHESSHHMLLPNRRANDILANLICFFPLWSSLLSYRAKHLGHHLHPNDPDKDPNFAGTKDELIFSKFPMPRPSFIWNYYAKFFWPPFVFRNLADLFHVLSVGAEKPKNLPFFLSPTKLGIVFLFTMVGLIYAFEATGNPRFVIGGPIAVYLVGVAIWLVIPGQHFRTSSSKLSYDPKLSGLLRVSFYAVAFVTISWIRHFGNFDLAPFYFGFWLLPLIYVFPYLMLLREVYQHANLGTDRLNNSRIIIADPFTRWAVLGYGNDFHLIHHIYPNIPHYNLKEAHHQLMEESSDYRDSIKETVGTFRAPEGGESLIESLGVGSKP